MSLEGFLDSSGTGARVVVETPYEYDGFTNGAMPQTRLVTSSLSKCVFSSPGLSPAAQANLEGGGRGADAWAGGGEEEMLARLAEIGDFADDASGAVASLQNNSIPKKIQEYESRSENNNVAHWLGGDVDAKRSRKRKRYHRHTPHQIQELEALFKECPHPDEKQRTELSKRLCLESRQVKFWFQNRRTQMKAQLERQQNVLLRQENEKLKLENLAICESMRSAICPNCGGSAALGDVSLEQQHLRLENARLRDELNWIVALVERFLGRSISSLSSHLTPHSSADASLDLVAAENEFPALCTIPSTSILPSVADYFVPGISSATPVVPPPPVRPVAPVNGIDGHQVGI